MSSIDKNKYSILKLILIFMVLQHYNEIDAKLERSIETIIKNVADIISVDELITEINRDKGNNKIKVNQSVQTVKQLLEKNKNNMSRVEYSGAINIILKNNLIELIEEHPSIQINKDYEIVSFMKLPQKQIDEKEPDFFIELSHH